MYVLKVEIPLGSSTEMAVKGKIYSLVAVILVSIIKRKKTMFKFVGISALAVYA